MRARGFCGAGSTCRGSSTASWTAISCARAWRGSIRSALSATSCSDAGGSFARVSTMESALYMRNQLLRDTDWASMAHSLEVRTPLVDAVLLERMAALGPPEAGAPAKQELANAPSKPLPAAVIERKKTGFGVPVASWIDGKALSPTYRSTATRATGHDTWRCSNVPMQRRSRQWPAKSVSIEDRRLSEQSSTSNLDARFRCSWRIRGDCAPQLRCARGVVCERVGGRRYGACSHHQWRYRAIAAESAI